MRLTILFDDPYWIGLLEDERDGCLYASRHVFGAEPSDAQVYDFVLRDIAVLLAQMTVGVPVTAAAAHTVGFKRRLREARRATEERGIASRAQDALRRQLEQNQQARRQVSREEREAEKEHKRAVARQKAREKHRGH